MPKGLAPLCQWLRFKIVSLNTVLLSFKSSIAGEIHPSYPVSDPYPRFFLQNVV